MSFLRIIQYLKGKGLRFRETDMDDAAVIRSLENLTARLTWQADCDEVIKLNSSTSILQFAKVHFPDWLRKHGKHGGTHAAEMKVIESIYRRELYSEHNLSDEEVLIHEGDRAVIQESLEIHGLKRTVELVVLLVQYYEKSSWIGSQRWPLRFIKSYHQELIECEAATPSRINRVHRMAQRLLDRERFVRAAHSSDG